MKTLIIQSYRTHRVPSWIARCLASTRAWSAVRGFDYLLTDDTSFELCGQDYLSRVGNNMCSITNLSRLELIRQALQRGYDQAIWIDADVHVFAPEQLDFPPVERISFAKEAWLGRNLDGWTMHQTLNNCVVQCPRGDRDLELIIATTRHRALQHPVTHNFQLGVHLIRGLHHFLEFPLLQHVGMFSNHALVAIAARDEQAMRVQAAGHETPVFAANLCGSDHLDPPVPEYLTQAAMDALGRSRGEVINRWLPSRPASAASVVK